MAEASPVNPQRVVWEMSPLLPANAIVTSDSGSCANWFGRDYRVQQGQSASLSGGLASMGAAVPYAIGAKFAHPDRPVIALVGDGAMQMNNMAELITVQKYWKRWADPRWIVCVFNNQDLNEVTWEQRVMEGNPKFDASQDIPDFPYARFGEMLGFKVSLSTHPIDWPQPGRKRSPATDRWCWRSRPIQMSCRSRRMASASANCTSDATGTSARRQRSSTDSNDRSAREATISAPSRR
jgi:thiamine pyrophosphate-dependent acetolactate synthase large subunit-like protein